MAKRHHFTVLPDHQQLIKRLLVFHDGKMMHCQALNYQKPAFHNKNTLLRV
jgi:hypothetical protein